MFDKASSSSDVINAFKNSDTVKALIQGSTVKDEERQDDGFTSITDDPFKSNMRDQDDGFGAIKSDPFVKANVFDNFTTGDWPVDLDGAFSPMSWGTQKSSGFGGGDKWKADFSVSTDGQKISNAEDDRAKDQKDENLIWDAPSADFDVKEGERRDDTLVTEVKDSDNREDDGTANEGIVSKRKQSGADQSECGSAVYEGFGTALSVESSDDEEEDESVDDDIEMNRSNDSDTQASATEFDPQSMFGEDDDNEEEEGDDVLSPEKKEDVFPTDKSATGSQNKPSDDSKSISFQSLNSGSQIKYTPPVPTSSSNKAPVPDSPAGTESLESWWQSRYASTQHQDINSAVQDALSKRVADGEPSDETSSPEVSVVSSPKLTVDVEETPQVVSNFEHRRSKSESSSKSRQKKHELLSPADSTGEDSIFSGLSVDDCTSLPKQATKQHTRVASQTLPVNSTETEDIFAGVSASHSRQLSNNRIQESNTAAMKSLFDGTSTVADSVVLGLSSRQSRMTLTANKVEESTQKGAATKIEDAKKKESPPVAPLKKEPNEVLFMPDADYGVIDLKNSETSPANSDITSSVIDYEFSRKSSHKKKNDALDVGGGEVEKLSAIKSADDYSSQEEANDYEDEEDVDMMNPKIEDVSQSGHDYSKSFSRGVSAMSASRGVSVDDDVTSYPSNSSSTLGETNHKGTVSALLSQLGCGTFAASSFAFCAMNQGKKRSILFVLYRTFIKYSTIYFFILLRLSRCHKHISL